MPILETTRAAALFVAAVAAAAGLVGSAGCSLVIESQDRQCESDADCSGFTDATCDIAGGVCVPRASTSSVVAASSGTDAGTGGSTATGTGTGGEDCVGPDGCFSCEPSAQAELLNACTDSACIPYDNGQLEGLLLEDGSVPPVP